MEKTKYTYWWEAERGRKKISWNMAWGGFKIPLSAFRGIILNFKGKALEMVLISFLGILLLALTHLFVKKLRFSQIPRSKWLSFAGGISVTYIFIVALPELREAQEHLEGKDGLDLSISLFEGHSIFLVALLGLVCFYGLENWAAKSTTSHREPKEGPEKKVEGIFWIHLSAFAVYNFVIGYLILNREQQSIKSLLLYSVAMAFHFMVTDSSLDDHFKAAYRRKGRWILVTFLFLGWVASLLVEIPEAVLGLVFAFIAGGIIMNVMKEELPRERESNFFAFLSGTVVYALFLALI